MKLGLHCGKPIDNGFEMYTCEGDLDLEWDPMMPAQAHDADRIIAEFWVSHMHPKQIDLREEEDDTSSEGRDSRLARG
jgi:hypothetical protein